MSLAHTVGNLTVKPLPEIREGWRVIQARIPDCEARDAR
jgi:hypothetical protein